MDTNANPAASNTAVTRMDKEGNIDLANLSPTETQHLQEVNKSLNPQDVNSVLNYGVEVQNSMEKYSNEFLSSVRTYNSGEVGGYINDLLTELNYIDVD